MVELLLIFGFLLTLGGLLLSTIRLHFLYLKIEEEKQQVMKDNVKGNEKIFVKEDVPFSTELNNMVEIFSLFENKFSETSATYLLEDKTIKNSNTKQQLDNILLYFNEYDTIPSDITYFLTEKQNLITQIKMETTKLAEMKHNSNSKLSTVSTAKMESMYRTFVLLINELDTLIKKQEEYEKTEWENMVSLTK